MKREDELLTEIFDANNHLSSGREADVLRAIKDELRTIGSEVPACELSTERLFDAIQNAPKPSLIPRFPAFKLLAVAAACALGTVVVFNFQREGQTKKVEEVAQNTSVRPSNDSKLSPNNIQAAEPKVGANVSPKKIDEIVSKKASPKAEAVVAQVQSGRRTSLKKLVIRDDLATKASPRAAMDIGLEEKKVKFAADPGLVQPDLAAEQRESQEDTLVVVDQSKQSENGHGVGVAQEVTIQNDVVFGG